MLDASAGVTFLDLLIVTMTIAACITLAVPLITSAKKPIGLATAAQEFSSHVQSARSDSKKRHAGSNPPMAYVTIVNPDYYYVVLDGNGDGVLDTPLMVSLTSRQVTVDGPFPRTFYFDWLGRTFDQNQSLMSTPAVRFSSGSGVTTVKFDGAGQPQITSGK